MTHTGRGDGPTPRNVWAVTGLLQKERRGHEIRLGGGRIWEELGQEDEYDQGAAYEIIKNYNIELKISDAPCLILELELPPDFPELRQYEATLSWRLTLWQTSYNGPGFSCYFS